MVLCNLNFSSLKTNENSKKKKKIFMPSFRVLTVKAKVFNPASPGFDSRPVLCKSRVRFPAGAPVYLFLLLKNPRILGNQSTCFYCSKSTVYLFLLLKIHEFSEIILLVFTAQNPRILGNRDQECIES